MRIKKMICLSAILVSFSCITAFAGKSSSPMYHNGDEVGEASIDVSYASGMRNCYALTRMDSSYYSSVYVTACYQDGSEYGFWSGIKQGNTNYEAGYEWTEDYTSIHRGYTSPVSYAFQEITLSED